MRLRVHRTPGFPCALCFVEGQVLACLGHFVPRERELMSANDAATVIAREEGCENISDLILRACECISDLILRSGVFAASRRMAASPCVASILRDACGVYHRAALRADPVASSSG